MEYKRYKTDQNNSQDKFYFVSEGPKGNISKQVKHVRLKDHPDVFNVAVGDLCFDGTVDYDATTSNWDTILVFATVAWTVSTFLNANPDKFVFAKGHTESRNRLYRRMLSNSLNEIEKHHYIYGLIGEKFYSFEKNQNYSGFMIKRKTHYLWIYEGRARKRLSAFQESLSCYPSTEF